MKNLVEQYASVIYDKKLSSMNVFFDGVISYENMMKVFHYEFRMVRYYCLRKCLIDVRNMKGITPEIKEYINHIWFYTISEEGMKNIAFVGPENILDEVFNTANEPSEGESLLKIKYFEDKEAAEGWLKQA